MTQPTPPPQQPQPEAQPADGNPFAQQPGAVPQPAAPAVPYTPAPVKNNIGLGLAGAFGAAVVVAGVYGAIIGLTKHEIGWAAVGVGFLIGLAAGRLGGRNPVLPVASAVLSLGAVYIGQLVGDAMLLADEAKVGFNEVFFQHFSVVQEAWKADADPLTFLFFAIAAYVAFTGARKAAL
jgi:hypothetical protein